MNRDLTKVGRVSTLNEPEQRGRNPSQGRFELIKPEITWISDVFVKYGGSIRTIVRLLLKVSVYSRPLERYLFLQIWYSVLLFVGVVSISVLTTYTDFLD